MPHLLILARDDAGAYRSRDGDSLLAGLPFDVTLFADDGNGYALRALEGEHEIEVVRWSDEPAVVARAALLHTGVPFTAVATFDARLAALADQVRAALGLDVAAPPPASPLLGQLQALLEAAAVPATASHRVPPPGKPGRVATLLRRVLH